MLQESQEPDSGTGEGRHFMEGMEKLGEVSENESR